MREMCMGDDFTGRLLAAGEINSTYDRYTFYRMLEQLGTDSSAETGPSNTVLMDLNYDNLDPFITNGIVYPPSETNFMAWTPIAFFTNAANRLLQTYTAQWMTAYTNPVVGNPVGQSYLIPVLNTNYLAQFCVANSFGITNIPVVISNQFCYTPAVNRLLQLAANLYDETSTNYYPSVFRPLFTVTNQNGWRNVYITGYTNVIGSRWHILTRNFRRRWIWQLC